MKSRFLQKHLFPRSVDLRNRDISGPKSLPDKKTPLGYLGFDVAVIDEEI